jgi:hypothetical protein
VTLWAQVSASGQLVRGSNAVGASRSSAGNYTVRFNRDVSQCVSGATIHNNVGQVNAYNGLTAPDEVYVGVHGSAGTPADQPFYVAVFC